MTHARVLLVAAAAVAVGLLFPATGAAQVAVDEDGAVRAPTAEEAAALAAAMADGLSQSDKGLVEVRLDDGTTLVDLQGRFESLSVAKVQGGAVETRCVTSPEEAAAFAAPGTPTLTAAER